MKKLRISSTTNLCGASMKNYGEYLKKEIAFQKSAGFDAIDLNLCHASIFDGDIDAQIEDALTFAAEQGIRFEVCHLPYIMAGATLDGDAFERFKARKMHAIDIAKRIGARYAVMHPNGPTVPLKTYNRKEQYDSVMRYLTPFAEYAAQSGVNVVVENMRVIPTFTACHRYSQTPDELCDVADALGIGVCWDFGHANINGLRQSEALAYVGERLKVVHVNDNFGVGDDHVPPFVGNVDWKDAMHGLALTGFDGLINFEISTGRIPESTRAAFAQYLIGVAHELMSYIE